MNYRIANILDGVLNSLAFGQQNNQAYALSQLRERAAHEARPIENIIQTTFKERMLGLFSFAALTLLAWSLCLALVANDAAPELVLVALAALPSVVYVACSWVRSRIRVDL